MTQRPKSRWKTIGRIEAHGLWAGLGAGASLLIAQIVAAGISGQSILLPFRHAASILMKERAFETPSLVAIALGLLVHVSASLMFGFLFSLVTSEEGKETRRSMGAQLAFGAIAGALIWLIDIPLIAAAFYPWIADTGLILQLVMHVVFFGLPMGYLYAKIRRDHPTFAWGHHREVEV